MRKRQSAIEAERAVRDAEIEEREAERRAKIERGRRELGFSRVPMLDPFPPDACDLCGCNVSVSFFEKHRSRCN